MDFPVEATILLDSFQDEAEVRKILRSHGFVLTDLRRHQVRVKGSFLNLKAAKASLEQLLNAQTQARTSPYSSPPVQTVSSGAIPKHYPNTGSVSGGRRSRSASRDKQPHASPSPTNAPAHWVSDASHDHPASPYRASPRADQRASFRHGHESFIIDADVYRYAWRLRKKDIDLILENHDVKMVEREFGDSCNISVQGKNASIAANKLQSLLNDLSKSLRTQEVPRKDIGHEGKALLERIRQSRDIHNSVLVCEMNDRLHLIGPSVKSYELKQRLMGRPVDRSGRTGRTFEKNSSRRSTSLPPLNGKNPDRDNGAFTNPSPVGAAGYSPSYDDKQEGAKLRRGAKTHLSRLFKRSQSESRVKNMPERPNGFAQETEDKCKQPISPKGRKQLLLFNTEGIGQRFKNWRKGKIKN